MNYSLKHKFENYRINIEVLDSNGAMILNEDGNKIDKISYDCEMLTSNVESNLRHLSHTLKAMMPDREISIEVYLHNKISGTYMNMFSFYVNADRFLKY